MAHRRIGPYATLTSLDAFQSATPGYTAQTVCVDFDGSTEYMQSDQSNATGLGINNVWTYAIWVKPEWGSAVGDCIIQFRGAQGGGGNYNLAELWCGTGGATQIFTRIWDSGGITRKQGQLTSVWTQNAWHQIVGTFDGTDTGDPFTLWKNGSMLAINKTQDTTCTMTDWKRITIGALVSGTAQHVSCRVHSVAVWNELLAGAEITAIYNSGDSDFNLQEDSGSYASSANLVGWWRLGHDYADMGKDYAGSPIDLMDEANNITGDDIETDAP